MFRHRTLVVFFTIFAFVCSRSLEAQLFVQFEANGATLDGDSTDPNHSDWSDLGSLSLIFTGGTGPGSLSTRFSMAADSTWPQMVQAWSQNKLLLISIETFVGGVLTDVYDYTDARFTDLSISYGGGSGGIISGIIEANHVGITHDPSGHEVIWDWSGGPVSTITQFPGDYDGDTDVDVSDYEKWRDQFGATMGNLGGGADGNADGLVNAADYTVWRDHQVGPTTPIPEPVAGLLLLIGVGGITSFRSVRSH